MKNLVPWLILLVAFAYYSILAAKSYTWIFVSGDSGDWLTASMIWMAPQPLGSPLYVFAGQFLNLFPGDLTIKMTILLSCLPSAVTVALVYASLLRLGTRTVTAITSSAVLLGAGVFLTQSTVLEQYSLAAMFAVAAFYANTYRRSDDTPSYPYRTALLLGLGTAAHIIILPISLIWILLEYKEWRIWVKPSLLYLACGPLLYSYVPILMAFHTEPIMSGWLSWTSLKSYVFDISGNIIGTMSIFELPNRLYFTGSMLIASLGLAAIPLMIVSHQWIRGQWAQDRYKKKIERAQLLYEKQQAEENSR